MIAAFQICDFALAPLCFARLLFARNLRCVLLLLILANFQIPSTVFVLLHASPAVLAFSVRPCVSAKRPDVVNLLEQGITDVRPIVAGEGGVEDSVASANRAVRICEVNDKQEQV